MMGTPNNIWLKSNALGNGRRDSGSRHITFKRSCPKLSPEDQIKLEQRIAHGSQLDAERAKIVMYRSQGLSRAQVAKELDCSPRRVSLWTSRFRDKGIEGLEDRRTCPPQNRPPESVPPHPASPASPPSPSIHISPMAEGNGSESSRHNVEEVSAEPFAPTASPGKATPKVTMRTVAAIAGVCKMTVSRVLSNHPNVSAKLREQVLKTVRETGYRPNPEVGKLMAHLRPQRVVRLQGSICSIQAESWNYCNDGLTNANFQNMVAGARERAESLGFTWETCSLEAFLAKPAHMAKVLYHRGIEGIFLPPPPFFFDTYRPNIFMDALWKDFAVVSATNAFDAPLIQRVVHNHFQNMMLVCHTLAHRGYRRIGLAMLKEHDKRGYHHYSGAYSAFHLLAGTMLQPYFYNRPLDPGTISRWYEQEKPEAIIVSNCIGAREVAEAIGLSIPGTVPIATLSLPNFNIAGIDELSEKLGATAADILSGMILSNNKGLSTRAATITMVPGTWQEGASVPQSWS